MSKTVREDLSVRAERAILVALHLPEKLKPFDDLAELEALAETAGAQVVDRLIQKKNEINPAFYLGRGKISQLAKRVRQHSGQVVTAVMWPKRLRRSKRTLPAPPQVGQVRIASLLAAPEPWQAGQGPRRL